MYELMHICVHMYKGERVGPYLSHSYVTVVFFVTVIIYRYILYYKKPLMGHIMDIHSFPLTIVSFPFCLSL